MGVVNVFVHYRDIDMAEFLSNDKSVQDSHPHTVYDLVANICHDGQPGTGEGGTYRVHIRHKGSNKWFELEDLHVQDLLPQMITLAEAYIQVLYTCINEYHYNIV